MAVFVCLFSEWTVIDKDQVCLMHSVVRANFLSKYMFSMSSLACHEVDLTGKLAGLLFCMFFCQL
jgi:hypothetical protein